MKQKEIPEEQDSKALKMLLEKQEYSFQYGFSESIMQKIQHKKEEPALWSDFVENLSLFFRWIAFGSAVTTFIFLFILFQEGAFSNADLYGFGDMNIYDAMSFNIYNYE